jgi:hypothetical protein
MDNKSSKQNSTEASVPNNDKFFFIWQPAV